MNNKPMVKKIEFFAGFMILLFLCFSSARSQSLTQTDVETIIAQAVSKAVELNQRVTVSITDKEGHHLGSFEMTGAPTMTRIRSVGTPGPRSLEDLLVPSLGASKSKAGTAGIFSTGGNAFTTRTASFIIQEHFPSLIDNTPGGPLYGVQFSTLPCSDIAISGLPLGLSGDPGGIPLYKNGAAVGGVGIEGDGLYTIDRNPADNDQSFEEIIAFAAARGFEAPPLIRGDNILVAGLRLPYANVPDAAASPVMPFGSLPGMLVEPIIVGQTSDFLPPTVLNGVPGQFSMRFPIIAGSTLTAAEVTQILGSAIETSNRVRAAIRQPLGSNARVTVAVVDTDGRVLGIYRQLDAPVFGFDVSVQKARTVNFMARSDAGAKLSAAGFGDFVARAQADGILLNGAIAFSDRGFGFLHRPLFPDGINDTDAGPFSTELGDWSPFNVGLQLALSFQAITNPMPMCRTASRTRRGMLPPCPCTAIPELKNGVQTFAGGVPIYRNGVHVGGVGVSGDGIEQDDIIAAGGANNFAPPEPIRSDKVFVRGVRLPFLKFPPRPFLP